MACRRRRAPPPSLSPPPPFPPTRLPGRAEREYPLATTDCRTTARTFTSPLSPSRHLLHTRTRTRYRRRQTGRRVSGSPSRGGGGGGRGEYSGSFRFDPYHHFPGTCTHKRISMGICLVKGSYYFLYINPRQLTSPCIKQIVFLKKYKLIIFSLF